VKNRVHLDVWVGEDVPAAVGRLREHGAIPPHEGQQGPHHRFTMVDPEGNEFCVS
jgi:Glyoxalase-like domain